jgi:hypothetical protein
MATRGTYGSLCWGARALAPVLLALGLPIGCSDPDVDSSSAREPGGSSLEAGGPAFDAAVDAGRSAHDTGPDAANPVGAADGAAPDAAGGAPPCSRPPPTSGNCPSYTRDVAPALERNCFSCHFDGSGMPLTSHDDVVERLEFMQFALSSCVMPPVGDLPKDDADTLLGWISCGAPDN